MLKDGRWGQANRKGGGGIPDYSHIILLKHTQYLSQYSFFLRIIIYSWLILPIKFNYPKKLHVFCIHFCTLEFGIVLGPRERREGGRVEEGRKGRK